MKIHITKANAFEIDPAKKYLMMVVPETDWTMAEVSDANEKLQKVFPNMAMIVTKPGTKFKIVDGKKHSYCI